MPYVVITHATFETREDAVAFHDNAFHHASNTILIYPGETRERTSYSFTAEEHPDGSLTVEECWHIDLFGILRRGRRPVIGVTPNWIQPVGGHDAYPALDVRGDPTRVIHNDILWQNTHGDGNTWEPGAYGWADADTME